MNLKKSAYIFLLPFLFLSACVADDLGIQNSEPVYSTGDREGLAFFVENCEPKTRSVNFTAGAMVKINSVWVGVFDLDDTNDTKDKTYRCVSSSSLEQCFIELNSSSDDKKYTNLIKVNLDPPTGKENHKFMMMTVVNFNDVTDQYGESLQQKLSSIETWQDFVDIAVDTKGAYTYPHDADSPMMAGFLRKNFTVESNALHVQVDQFDNDKIFPLTLLSTDEEAQETGETVPDGILPVTFNQTTNKYDTDGYAFRLRRLVANINVNIEPVNSYIQITNVSYRRHNMPEAVYIIERRTANFTQDDKGAITIEEIPSTREHAANFADKVWDDYHTGRNEGYIYETGFTDDEEWQINSNRDSNTGIWSFSFQHFANKHWARTSIQNSSETDYNVKYSQREARTYLPSGNDSDEAPKYYFTNLASGIDDFNNKASYFEVKIHMVDTRNNRCAEAIYVIHEGNTSNVAGVEVNGGNLDDFTVARNISYIYNIKVDGFENILLNVAHDKESQEYTHHPDQGGKIWKMIYLNDPQGNQRHYYVDFESGEGHFENVLKGSTSDAGEYNVDIITKDENGVEQTNKYIKFVNAMTFAPKPNISFRLYGYTNYRTKYNKDEVEREGGISGYNYNFERSSFTNLYGLWPPSAAEYSHYFMDDISLDIQEIPTDLRTGVMIQEAGDEKNYIMNMIEFVNHASSQEVEKTYNVYISESNLKEGVIKNGDWPVTDANKEKYVRAIYIADRNGVWDSVDKCSQQVNVYCVAQYPEYEGEKYEMIMAHHQNSAILPYNPNSEPYKVDNNLANITGLVSTDLLHDGLGMVFTKDAKLAFRLIGFDDNDNYVDYCYNFDINNSAYYKYREEWPYFINATRFNNQTSIINKDVPMTELMGSLKIQLSDGSTKTVKEFIDGYPEMVNNKVYAEGFVTDTYNHAGEMSAGIRRLYIFDKNIVEEKRLYDTKMKDYYHQIYGISQYPYDNTVKVSFLVSARGNEYMMKKWAGEYYSNLVQDNPTEKDNVNYNIHYTTGSANWTGTINSIIYMPFTMTVADWIESYTIDFIKDKEVVKTISLSKKDFIDMQGTDDFVILEEHTDTGWEEGTYDVVITPIPVDDGKLYSGYRPVTLTKQLEINPQVWNFSEAPWSAIKNEDLDINCNHDGKYEHENCYFHNFNKKYYSDERNFFFNYYGMEFGVYTVKHNTFSLNTDKDEEGSPEFIPTFYDQKDLVRNGIQEMVDDGPTQGRPYQFKFTTLKEGVLYIDATTTGDPDPSRTIFVKVGKQNPVPISNFNKKTVHSPLKPFEVKGVDTKNGTEVLIYTPISESSQITVDGKTYNINGTLRIYGFSLDTNKNTGSVP